MKTKLKVIKKRPGSNIRGLTYKYTLGNLFWFVSTVKENLGYSVALAIYGPFTFYFITQPMNPHAMRAVGKLRNAYIETVTTIEDITTSKSIEETAKIAKCIYLIGNHDFLENNIDRLDAITPIVDSIDNDNIVYFKERGCYDDDNILWCVYTLVEHNISPEIPKDTDKYKIGLSLPLSLSISLSLSLSLYIYICTYYTFIYIYIHEHVYHIWLSSAQLGLARLGSAELG